MNIEHQNPQLKLSHFEISTISGDALGSELRYWKSLETAYTALFFRGIKLSGSLNCVFPPSIAAHYIELLRSYGSRHYRSLSMGEFSDLAEEFRLRGHSQAWQILTNQHRMRRVARLFDRFSYFLTPFALSSENVKRSLYEESYEAKIPENGGFIELCQLANTFEFYSPLDISFLKVPDDLTNAVPTLEEQLWNGKQLETLCRNPLQLLSVSVVGSRRLDPFFQSISAMIGALIGYSGAWLISGGANGADLQSELGSLKAGGKVLEIRPAGLLVDWGIEYWFRRNYSFHSGGYLPKAEYPPVNLANWPKKEYSNRTHPVCACASAVHGQESFSRENAMERNKFTYALGNITIIIQSRLKEGGTWFGAASALKQAQRPILVINDGSEAAKCLIDRGACSLSFETLQSIHHLWQVYCKQVTTEKPRYIGQEKNGHFSAKAKDLRRACQPHRHKKDSETHTSNQQSADETSIQLLSKIIDLFWKAVSDSIHSRPQTLF